MTFNIEEAVIRLFGVGGRTVEKLCHFDESTIETFGPDVILLEIGTNDLAKTAPEVVGSEVDDLVKDLLYWHLSSD